MPLRSAHQARIQLVTGPEHEGILADMLREVEAMYFRALHRANLDYAVRSADCAQRKGACRRPIRAAPHAPANPPLRPIAVLFRRSPNDERRSQRVAAHSWHG